MPNGTRRAHTRNGHPVRASSIKGRQAPKKRLNAGARRRAQRKPLLYAAGTLAGLGALDAILTGRWGVALVLFSFAGGFLVAHAARQHHLKRKVARQSPAEQRRKALAKAREQRKAGPTHEDPAPSGDGPPEMLSAPELNRKRATRRGEPIREGAK